MEESTKIEIMKLAAQMVNDGVSANNKGILHNTKKIGEQKRIMDYHGLYEGNVEFLINIFHNKFKVLNS